MSDTITISVERVREAAKSCPDAKRVLEILAPEAFAPVDDIVPPPRDCMTVVGDNGYFIAVCVGGNYAYRGLDLGADLRWEVVTDNCGRQVIIARRKEQNA